jgi:hypothetical protein
MVSFCSGGLAVRRAAANVELILKINKYCYLLNLVGLDFITLRTLKMHGQIQVKLALCSFFQPFNTPPSGLSHTVCNVTRLVGIPPRSLCSNLPYYFCLDSRNWLALLKGREVQIVLENQK